MNTHWSQYVQTPDMLYRSRAVRFHDRNRDLWLEAIGAKGDMDILEIGCGPGLFTHRVKQYLPDARVTGLDLDDGFIAYSREKASELALDCAYVQGDALAMPFADASFDLCYSHTVSEHLPIQPFLLEQRRVLRPGGRITVLSVRTNASLPDCGENGTTPEEAALWEKLNRAGEGKTPIPVCAHPMTESEFPLALEEAGFREVDLRFFCVTYYAPDSSSVPPELALEQIEADRICALEGLAVLTRLAPAALHDGERQRLLTLVNARFDARVTSWRANEKRWDVTAKMILVATGIR